ncbi:MAG: hypothetical protein U0325_33090 [Polyangiales bacterium]
MHASPGTPAVDVGIPGAGTAFTGVFNNVAFPNGSSYVNTAPLANATLAARVANTATAAGAYPLQLDGVTLPAGARATVFAVGILNSDQVPLSALVCTEGPAMGAVIHAAARAGVRARGSPRARRARGGLLPPPRERHELRGGLAHAARPGLLGGLLVPDDDPLPRAPRPAPTSRASSRPTAPTATRRSRGSPT